MWYQNLILSSIKLFANHGKDENLTKEFCSKADNILEVKE